MKEAKPFYEGLMEPVTGRWLTPEEIDAHLEKRADEILKQWQFEVSDVEATPLNKKKLTAVVTGAAAAGLTVASTVIALTTGGGPSEAHSFQEALWPNITFVTVGGISMLTTVASFMISSDLGWREQNHRFLTD